MQRTHANTRPPRRLGSVQQLFVQVQGIADEVLCVGLPGRPAAYIGVLEVGGIAYDLKSQQEQERLNAQWQHLLAGITFPVQVLWRSLPLRLDPYLERFQRQPDAEGGQSGVWDTLAAAHVQHVQRLAARRPLLQRRIYLLTRVSAEERANTGLKGLFWPGTPRPQADDALDQARTELEVRLTTLARHLERLHLSARRLAGLVELGQFYHSCLTPLTAAQFPLAAELLEGVDRPPSVLRANAKDAGEPLPLPLIFTAWSLCPHCQAQMPAGAAFCADCGGALQGAPRPAPDTPLLLPVSGPQMARPPLVLPGAEPASAALVAESQAQRRPRRWLPRLKCQRGPTLVAPRQTLFSQVADLLAPSAIDVLPDQLRVGEEYQQVLVVTGLPRTVEAGWLRPLLELDESFELSFQFLPQEQVRMEDLLRRKRTQFQATRLLAQGKGNLVDPHIEIAQQDIDTLVTRIASGAERLFDVLWLMRVWGSTPKELAERARRIQSLLHSLRLTWRVATYEQGPGYRSCLPQVRPQLESEGLLLPSETLSTAFPFVAASLFHDQGVLVGVTPTRELIVLNPWARASRVANANMVIFGPSGQGKSTLIKTLVTRLALGYQLQQPQDALGFQLFVIDPDREYDVQAAALGGQTVRLSPGSLDRINPFDLPCLRPDRVTGQDEQVDVLSEQISQVHRLLAILIAEHGDQGEPGVFTREETSVLDLALIATYQAAGITHDWRTHTQPAPLLADLVRVLETPPAGGTRQSLADRLKFFTEGSGSGLFSGPTTLHVKTPVVVFDTSACKTDLDQIIAQFLISTFVWGQAFLGTIPRFLVVDEAATWMQYSGGKKALEDYTRRARKHFLSIISITQHPDTFVGSNVIDNSAIKFLLCPDPASLGQIRDLFHLSEREGECLLRLDIGEALLLVADKQQGSQRLVVKHEVSELELVLAQTDPSVLAAWAKQPEYASLHRLLQGLAAGGLGNLAAFLGEASA
jgi:hypothetical protein